MESLVVGERWVTRNGAPRRAAHHGGDLLGMIRIFHPEQKSAIHAASPQKRRRRHRRRSPQGRIPRAWRPWRPAARPALVR